MYVFLRSCTRNFYVLLHLVINDFIYLKVKPKSITGKVDQTMSLKFTRIPFDSSHHINSRYLCILVGCFNTFFRWKKHSARLPSRARLKFRYAVSKIGNTCVTPRFHIFMYSYGQNSCQTCIKSRLTHRII